MACVGKGGRTVVLAVFFVFWRIIGSPLVVSREKRLALVAVCQTSRFVICFPAAAIFPPARVTVAYAMCWFFFRGGTPHALHFFWTPLSLVPARRVSKMTAHKSSCPDPLIPAVWKRSRWFYDHSALNFRFVAGFPAKFSGFTSMWHVFVCLRLR